MFVTDERSASTVDVDDIFGNDFVVESVLDCLSTEDLFSCAEVNRLWQAAALSRLRKRLISVSVCCSPDTEHLIEEPVPNRLHACVEILCSKFARYRNIARLAGMRPSLVFLSYHADLSEDPRVVNSVRQLLPADAVIVYFKLELVRTANDTDDNSHEGVFGEFLFHAEPAARPVASDDDQQQPSPPPESLVSGQELGHPSESEPMPPRRAPRGPVATTADAGAPVTAEQPAATNAPAVADAPDAAPAAAVPPAALPPVLWPRPRHPPTGRGCGAVFHNVLPGVLVFEALHVTEGTLEADVANSCFTEEYSGRVIKVMSVAIFNAMQSNRLDPFMRILGDSFGPTTDTIAVAFPRNQDEARLELDAFERRFPRVPALANQATEFNVDGQFAPIGRLKLILLLIKLQE